MSKLIQVACILSIASCDAPPEEISEAEQAIFGIGDGGAGASETATSTGSGSYGGAGGYAAGGAGADYGVGGWMGMGGEGGAPQPPQPPQELVLQCGKSQAATAIDNRNLSITTFGYTKEQARAKCEAAVNWKSNYMRCKASNCQALEAKVKELDPNLWATPNCLPYFGPDVEETQACQCVGGQNFWNCTKKGVIPVGDKFECLGCYIHYVWLKCGLVSKIPEGASRTVKAHVWGATEAAARAKCDTAEYKADDLICHREPNTPSFAKFPAASVENKTIVHCSAPSTPGAEWSCRCDGVAKATADFDCRHCAPPPNPPPNPQPQPQPQPQ